MIRLATELLDDSARTGEVDSSTACALAVVVLAIFADSTYECIECKATVPGPRDTTGVCWHCLEDAMEGDTPS
jgi:hypothetical protein